MATFKAISIEQKGDLDHIFLKDFPLPPLSPDQVLIKMECSTINPSDILTILGSYPSSGATTIAGREGSGTVVQSGGGTEADSLLNKRVAVYTEGTWSEYAVATIGTSIIVPLLDSVSFEQASGLLVNPLTVAMFIDYITRGGHKAFIQNAAASSLGKMLIKWGLRLNIPSINLVRRDEQVQILKAIGAEHVFNTSEEGWKERVSELVGRIKATCGFDCVGGTATNDIAEVVESDGIVYNYGLLSGKQCEIGSMSLLFKGIRAKGLWLVPWYAGKSEEEKEKLGRLVQENIDILANEYNQETELSGVKRALDSYSETATNNKVLIRTRI
jgi:NADPH:quinone reductase